MSEQAPSNSLSSLLARLREDGGRYLLSVALTREERAAAKAPDFGGKPSKRWLTDEEYAALCALGTAPEPPTEHGGSIMTLAECAEAESGIPFQAMEANTDPLTHQEIFSAVLHHASEIKRLTECVPATCSGQPPPLAHPFGNGTRESLMNAILSLRLARNNGDADQVQSVLDWLGPDTRSTSTKSGEQS